VVAGDRGSEHTPKIVDSWVNDLKSLIQHSFIPNSAVNNVSSEQTTPYMSNHLSGKLAIFADFC